MDNSLSILENAYWGNNPDEANIHDFLKPILPLYPCFVDVGASLGQYTRFAAEHMKKGYIMAFEPDRIRFDALVANVMGWREQFNATIFTFNYALGAEAGKQVFHLSPNSHSGSLLKNQYHVQTSEVPVSILDRLILPEKSLIKMDVEGTELDVLAGATQLLQDKFADWLIECHNFGTHTRPEVIKVMKEAGYTLHELDSSHLFFEVA